MYGILFRGATIWDGSGTRPFPGDVLVGGHRIIAVSASTNTLVQSTHGFQRRVNCHARTSEAVKRAARQRFDAIYHCERAVDEALDLLDARKDQILVGPTDPLAGVSVLPHAANLVAIMKGGRFHKNTVQASRALKPQRG